MSRALEPSGPARLLARPSVAAVLGALADPAEETRLVGGCVRDALLGLSVSDIDLATTLHPDATLARARAAGLKAIPTGIEHGTITVVAAGEPVEVTTLREDVETDGRHAVVRFGRDFRRDAERRDFTVNALSVGADGRLHDLTDGVADLAAGRLRFIGDPPTRIREDALRILRFFRFHARYAAGPPDPAGLAACIAARAALDGLSRERVRAEFLKLLGALGALRAVAVLSETGLLARITGGVADLGRLARAVAADADAIGRLGALAVGSTPDADRLRERLRLSKAEHAALLAQARGVAALRSPEAIGAQAMRGLAAEHGSAVLADALAILDGEPRPRVEPAARAALDDLLRAGSGGPLLPLTGADLVAQGVPPGPRIGQALAAARRLWLAEGCPQGDAARATLLAHALAAVTT